MNFLHMVRFEAVSRGFPAQTQFLPPDHTLHMDILNKICWVPGHTRGVELEKLVCLMSKPTLNPLTLSTIFTSHLTPRECLLIHSSPQFHTPLVVISNLCDSIPSVV